MSPQQTAPRQRTTQDLSALHPSYTIYGYWDQWFNPYWGQCVFYGNYYNEVLWEPCDQSDIYEYLQYNNPDTNVHFNTLDGYGSSEGGCIHNEGSWLEESNTCTYWSLYSNNELHDKSSMSYCAEFNSDGVMDEGACNGSDGMEDSVYWDNGLGANPYPYQTNTISPYTPAHTQYVLDVSGNGRANGTHIDIAPYNGTSAQKWEFVYNSTYQAYQVQLIGTTKCLDKPSNEHGSGVYVQLWDCNGAVQQMWAYVTPSQLVNVQDGTCLDTPTGNFSNPRVWTYACWGGLNQQWEVP